MKFRLVDHGWADLLDECLKADRSHIRIVAPFIKENAAKRFLQYGKPKRIEVITRFNLTDFASGVSDVSALRLLLKNGAKIRGVKNLHAKLYVFGTGRAVGTSANLTDAGLLRNHEFGFDAADPEIVEECCAYFDGLWAKAGKDVTAVQLKSFQSEVDGYLASGANPKLRVKLKDHGANAGLEAVQELIVAKPWTLGQAFVKFFGQGHRRSEWTIPILEEVNRSGSHWAMTYPKGKRPTGVKEGATLFIGRMVKEPSDILVVGRAVGMRHQVGRDDATAADIKLRGWKAAWPHYVRVHDAEFVAGTLENGVPLSALWKALEASAAASTLRNTAKGSGNTDPRQAYKQQPGIQLSPQGASWMNTQLEAAFRRHGKLSAEALATLDWPKVPKT